jgi:hypothetical protein
LFVFALASLLQLLFGESKMNKLSQSAQAVIDATGATGTSLELAARGIAAAALRVAADQVVPEEPLHGGDQRWMYERDARQASRRKLLSIADELDGATTTSENG